MRYLYFILLFALSVGLMAQDRYKLGVDELFEKGLQNSLSIQKSVVQTYISSDQVGLAKNKRLPDISVGGLFGYAGTPIIMDKDLSFLQRSDAPDWKQNYQVSLTQPVFEGGRIKNNIHKSELQDEFARLSLEKNKSDLKLWLISQYLDLFNLYKEREVYAQNINESKIRLHDIEQMKEQGMITTNDVLRSQLVLTNYELSFKETENDIVLASQQLCIVLGMDESLIIEPDSTVLDQSYGIKQENDYVAEAYGQFPGLQMAHINRSMAETDLKIARSDYLPSLSLQASNTLARPIPNVTPAQDLFVNSWGISLNLSLRISSFFDKKHNMNVAKHNIYLQKLEEEQQKQDIRSNVKAAFIKHNEALDRIKALEGSVAQAKENYRIVKNKYYNQLAILTDLLDANTVLLDSELQLTTARTGAIYTYYQLQQVSGNL